MATHVYEPEAEALALDGASELRIESVPGRSCVLRGVRTTIPVLIRIQGPDANAEQQRQPLHVACVLDCSGSMQGDKLNFAKQASLKLVKHLGPGDVLHFVAYDTSVRTVFENGDLSEAGKERLQACVRALQVRGQTNLLGGLERAAELLSASGAGHLQPEPELEGAEETSGAECVRRIFIFSDGHVNVGVTDPVEIKRAVATWAAAGITTSSFGIGNDFDEALMQGIADHGRGQYLFLPTAHSIPRLVSKAVHGLLELYASEAALEMRGCAHTTVTRVYGADDPDMTSSTEYHGVAPGALALGDIQAGRELKALVEIDICLPGDFGVGATLQALEWTLSFQRKGCPVQLCGRVELSATSDRNAAACPEAPAVLAAIAVQKASQLDDEVAYLLSRGRRGEAKNTKAKQINLLQKVLQDLQGADGLEGSDASLLQHILERSKRAQEQLEDDDEDEETVRRQCTQDARRHRRGCGASGSGVDSDEDHDIAIMEDVASGSGNNEDSDDLSSGWECDESNTDTGDELACQSQHSLSEGPCGPPLSLRPVLFFNQHRSSNIAATVGAPLKSCLKPQSRVSH